MKRARSMWRHASAAVLMAATWPALASATTHWAKLGPSDGQQFDTFGLAIAIDGSTVIVSKGAVIPQSGPGSLYAFTQAGGKWTQAQKFQPPGIQIGEWFGALDLEGTTLVASTTPQLNTLGSNAATAYVFEKSGSTWAATQQLLPSDPGAQDDFGSWIAVSGTTAVVGAARKGDQGPGSGAVYVFDKVGSAWTQTQKLVASDGAATHIFGTSVDISGSTIAVGAPGDASHGNFTGAVYVFQKGGSVWSETQKLVASDAAAKRYFGERVALSGTSLVVSAWGDAAQGNNAGAVYAFEQSSDTYAQVQKIVPADAGAQDRFGAALALRNGLLVVGSVGDDDRGINTGATYLFTKSGPTWTQLRKITTSDSTTDEDFGAAVATDGTWLAVAADANGLPLTGSTYLYGKTDADGDGYPAEVDCLDTNANVNPGKTEVKNNGLDDDCNASTPDTGCGSVAGADARSAGPFGLAAVVLGMVARAARRNRRWSRARR